MSDNILFGIRLSETSSVFPLCLAEPLVGHWRLELQISNERQILLTPAIFIAYSQCYSLWSGTSYNHIHNWTQATPLCSLHIQNKKFTQLLIAILHTQLRVPRIRESTYYIISNVATQSLQLLPIKQVCFVYQFRHCPIFNCNIHLICTFYYTIHTVKIQYYIINKFFKENRAARSRDSIFSITAIFATTRIYFSLIRPKLFISLHLPQLL